jgi:hypothetical protein
MKRYRAVLINDQDRIKARNNGLAYPGYMYVWHIYDQQGQFVCTYAALKGMFFHPNNALANI